MEIGEIQEMGTEYKHYENRTTELENEQKLHIENKIKNE